MLGFSVPILKKDGGRASLKRTLSSSASVGWQNMSSFWFSLSHSVVPQGRTLGRPRKPVITLKGSLPCFRFRFRGRISSDPNIGFGNLNTRRSSVVLKGGLGLLSWLKLSGQLFEFKAVSLRVRVTFSVIVIVTVLITLVVVLVNIIGDIFARLQQQGRYWSFWKIG